MRSLRRCPRLRGGDEGEAEDNGEETASTGKVLTDEEFKRFAAGEEFILTATRKGFGKRTSAYEYRITGRGGSGIVAIGMGKKNSAVIASFPVEESDDLMMISD